MKFNPTTRTLTLEPVDCRTCRYGAGEQGQYTGQKTCAVCHGSGDGPKGGKGKCRGCSGRGKQPDFDNPIVCPSCGGDYRGHDRETFTDYAPSEAIESMPMIFLVLNRANTWNEDHLGMGTLWSCADYGDRWTRMVADARAVDPESSIVEGINSIAQLLMAEAREDLRTQGTQACKIARYERAALRATGDSNTAVLHDSLVYTLTRSGYQVRAMSDLPENATTNGIAERKPQPAGFSEFSSLTDD